MNRIVAPTEGQPIEALAPAAKTFTVLSPVGTPPKITRKTAAPRLESLDGKTIYLVDCRFDDSIELLKQVAGLVRRPYAERDDADRVVVGDLQKDDPKTWERSRPTAMPPSSASAIAALARRRSTMHAITLDTKYGVPTVAIHTDKFDKVVESVARMAGLPEAPRSFVPQPVMGKTAAELAAYVDGKTRSPAGR